MNRQHGKTDKKLNVERNSMLLPIYVRTETAQFTCCNSTRADLLFTPFVCEVRVRRFIFILLYARTQANVHTLQIQICTSFAALEGRAHTFRIVSSYKSVGNACDLKWNYV